MGKWLYCGDGAVDCGGVKIDGGVKDVVKGKGVS